MFNLPSEEVRFNQKGEEWRTFQKQLQAPRHTTPRALDCSGTGKYHPGSIPKAPELKGKHKLGLQVSVFFLKVFSTCLVSSGTIPLED
jgi:hypothetical protein